MSASEDLEFKNVLVIGNGFDLNLGLRTSYGDFVESARFQHLARKNLLASYLKNKYDQKNWVDIESELIFLSKKYAADQRHTLQQEYDAVCEALTDYISDIDYSRLNKDSQAAELLRTLSSEGGLCVVNFNYTKSVELILEGNNEPELFVHVHGNAEDRNIVFGVQDNAKIESNHVFLRKGAAPGLYVKYLVSDLMQAATERVYIFGHSLGETDRSQFDSFFPVGPRTKKFNINIYYHSKSSYYELYEQLDYLTINELQNFRVTHNLHMVGPEIQPECT